VSAHSTLLQVIAGSATSDRHCQLSLLLHAMEGHQLAKVLANRLRNKTSGRIEPGKYPPAKPGALVLEPLEAACPCCFNSAALLRRGMSQQHVSEQSA
jgi:hypothetical protein